MTAYPDDYDDTNFRGNSIEELSEVIALLEKARGQTLTADVDMEEIEQLVGMVHCFTNKLTAALAGEAVSAL